MSVQTFDISTRSGGFRDRAGDREEPELPQRHDGIPDAPVYEFDLQRSSADALGEMYMRLNFAVQKWWESAFFKPHR